MQLTYEKLYTEILNGTIPADVRTQVQSLSPENRVRLADALESYRKMTSEIRWDSRSVEEVMSILSTLSLASAIAGSVHEPDVRIDPDLKPGDVVRSTDAYWARSGQHLLGSITRLERVPDHQTGVVGSDYWAYLSSGEGPVSLACLEKAPTA